MYSKQRVSEEIVLTFLAVDNPVMRAELKHQRHVMRTSRSGWFWIVLAVVMLLPAFLSALTVIVAGLLRINLLPVVFTPPFNLVANIGLVSLVIMHFALYIVVTLVTLALAASSITREQTSRTWESLLLTEMSARQIVLGKWWATLRALWGDHVLVLVLRLGFVAWLHWMGSSPDQPDPMRLLIVLLVVTVLTLADNGLTTVIGILPPVSGRNPVILTLALALRLMASVGVLVLTSVIGLLAHDWTPLLMIATLVGMAGCVVLTAGAARLAEWAAVRNLASPQPNKS